MYFVSEQYLLNYQESGEVGGITLGEVAPLGQSLFPADAEAERLPKSKRGPKNKRQ